MAQSVSPIDFEAAVERQLDLWNESRELVDRDGETVYTRTETPVVTADEVIGSHEFDEAKGEEERRTNAERPERVQKVTAVNKVSGKVLPSESLSGCEEAWRDLAVRGSGIYRGLHPTMKRDGVYVYGCPHLLVFEDERPVRVIRLRGTKYVKRPEPYSSQLVGPWLTCRILERGHFDAGNLSFTLVRYDRREHPDVDRVELLSKIQHAYATDQMIQNVDIAEAVDGFPDLRVNTYEYDSGFEHDGTRFSNRLRRSLAIIRGEQEPSIRE